jgi:hypothetical protein
MVALLGGEIIDADAGGVAIIELRTDLGTLHIAGEFTQEGATLIAKGVHIDGPGAGIFGLKGLYELGCALLESFENVDTIRIHGTRRTTGKAAGKIPRPIILTKSRCRSRGMA